MYPDNGRRAAGGGRRAMGSLTVGHCRGPRNYRLPCSSKPTRPRRQGKGTPQGASIFGGEIVNGQQN